MLSLATHNLSLSPSLGKQISLNPSAYSIRDMALPPNSEFRGVAAAIPQPASNADISRLMEYIGGLTLYNAQGPRILYRDPNNDHDIVEAVYRWDDRPYAEIFRGGFPPRNPGSTTWDDYYNLELHVNGGGAPVDTSPASASVFVSTTRSTSWRPLVTTDVILYRYEIFAPGGIDAVLTLGGHNNYPNQQEISFAGGISRQYIRSARPYAVVTSPGQQFATFTPYGNRIYRNGHFNPNPTSTGQTSQQFMDRLRNVYCPTSGEYLINVVYAAQRVEKRDVKDNESLIVKEEPYVDPSCKLGRYIECAFNFNNSEEAYLFTTDQCLRINYAPGTTDDRIINGPMSIGTGFPYLRDTIFASGIDAAFTSSRTNEAYIFRSNIYALINFVGNSIIQGPKKITDSFYSLRNTIFESGIDAAFASSRKDEAYIFKGDQYALINFAPGTTNDKIIQGPKKITLSFPSLKNTIFKDGFDAAFSSSRKNEAYIFKGNTYALINYAPGTTDDYIVNGPITPISDGFHSLKGIIPMYPCGC
ncbi:uncharacterized protein LOC130777736 [Actinidia eriantha]|uniref:uncharacterized protein LOC130777736 n=1 Tax=Actinidia eriantha TaxID=165200 RepID=UPI0025859D45|nr:uncharacterized protein LOC130777736 [Actinidia eriantha]